MRTLITNYTFNKATKQITFTDYGSISLERVLLVVDVSNGITIYQPNNAALLGSVSTNVLTLDYNTNTGSFDNADKLEIFYEADTQAVSASSLPLPTGASTSALQSTGNTSLAAIDTKLGGTIAVSGPLTDAQLRATPVPVSGSFSVSGGATEAKQDVGNASLADIDTNTVDLPNVIAAEGGAQPSKGMVVMGHTGAGVVRHVLVDTSGRQVVNVNTSGLPTGAATSALQTSGNASLSGINTNTLDIPNVIATIGSTAPAKAVALGLQDTDGNLIIAPATENDAVGVGNAMKKFRDGFADLAQGAAPDSSIWDISWQNQGDSFVGRAGDAQGSSYMKISMSPMMRGSQFSMVTKRSFKYPMRFINMLSISQRILGQELDVSIVGADGSGVVTTLTPKADLTISGTVSITSNVATINFAAAHGLKTSDRVLLLNNTERRLNVGPVVVTVITATQITVPCTLGNGTYTAGGVVRWADAFDYAKNAAGLLLENTTATNASFVTRRNGFNTRSLNSTIVTTANSTTVNYADPFNATSMNLVIANQEEFTIIPRAPDSSVAPSSSLKWNQNLPDEELEYKIRIRAKNLDNMTSPVARITAIAKTGTTTATVTTDAPHGLAVTDFVQIYGVRDITNFPNLTAQTQVASIVSPTQFTIVIGSASTSSSAGGTVFLNQGSVLAPGISAINVQSIARTANVLSLVGNTTWTGILPGETVHLYGCDATSMGLYDGAYKVLRISTTTLELESTGVDFVSINCGGAIMKRTDFRVHAISEIEHTRLIAELSNSQGSNDTSKAVPVVVNNAPSVTIGANSSVNLSQMGGSAVAAGVLEQASTTNRVLATSLAAPSRNNVNEVASAAITSTGNGATITATAGTSFSAVVQVTASSGTTPTLDQILQESFDDGTTWIDVWHVERLTGVSTAIVPLRPAMGRRRWNHVISGTTPSFTRVINTMLSSVSALPLYQFFDRTANVLNGTLNATTSSYWVAGAKILNARITLGAATTPATYQFQVSDNNSNWANVGTPTVAVANATTNLVPIENISARFARLIVTGAATAQTGTFVTITGSN